MFDLLRLLEKLNSPRRGWVKRGIPNSDLETINQHMYQMAMILMAYPGWENVDDRLAAVEMAIVHDALEAIAGDVIPSDNISRERKQAREELGLEYLVCLSKESRNDAFASRISRLWKEYEEAASHVSRIVHQVDKFQALSQAYAYSRRYPELSLQLDDFKSHREHITDDWLGGKADDILRVWEANDSHKISDTIFIFVMGGPGVGKGTQCELAAQKFGFRHVSVGELLRYERGVPGSLYRDFIERSFRESVPVPPTLVMKLLSRELQRLGTDGKSMRGVIVDGFPLSEDQLRAFEEEVSLWYATIVMECPPEVMLQRLTKRAMSSDREDDAGDRAKKRIDIFTQSDTQGLLAQLSKNPLRKIDCVGSIAEVQAAFQSFIAMEMEAFKTRKLD